MKVFALFADKTACEVVLELCAPDPGGDPVKATVVGAEDAAIRVSAERAVKTGYFLLTRRGYDPSKLRYFASFDLEVPAGVPVSGDSAGAAFLVKFLTAVVEQESGRNYGNRAVAATGVIAGASGDARIARVDGIAEKIRAAHETLPPGEIVLVPAENVGELRDTGEMAQLDPQAVARLKSLRNIGDVMDWVDGIMPLGTHLPARTRITRAAPSLASVASAEGHGPKHPPTLPAAPTPASLLFSPRSGAPLWLKRIALYAASFCLGPLILLIAILGQGRATTNASAPGPTPIAATPVSETTNLLAPPAGAVPGEAPSIVAGYFEYETAPGRRARASLKEKMPGISIPSDYQIAFRGLRFSAMTHLYIISCEPQEPALSLLFPQPGFKFQNPLFAEPASGQGYDLPSFEFGDLPEGRTSVYETLYLITSGFPLENLKPMMDRFDDAVIEKDKAKARALLRRLADALETPHPGLEVLKIQFQHVEPSLERTREAISTDTLNTE